MKDLMAMRNTGLTNLLIALVAFFALPAISGNLATQSPIQHLPAVRASSAMRSSMLSVTRAGDRIVAVGDRGVILISDDEGASYRQAESVPTRATLTSVSFAPDGHVGWAVGHWGVVLVTEDGGNRWSLQRDDLSVDQPLFSVSFTDANHGMAVGLWSLLIRTENGGKTWTTSPLEEQHSVGSSSKGSERNLYSLIRSSKGTLIISAEGGIVYRSTNAGKSWVPIESGGKGSLWAAISLKSGVLLVTGLSGAIFRSLDDGLTWQPVKSPTKSSITALTQTIEGKVVAVGLNGVVLVSEDDGQSFHVAMTLPNGTGIGAVIGSRQGSTLLFGESGPIAGKVQ